MEAIAEVREPLATVDTLTYVMGRATTAARETRREYTVYADEGGAWGLGPEYPHRECHRLIIAPNGETTIRGDRSFSERTHP